MNEWRANGVEMGFFDSELYRFFSSSSLQKLLYLMADGRCGESRRNMNMSMRCAVTNACATQIEMRACR